MNLLIGGLAILFKGFDKFRKKLPALSGSKIVVLPIYAAIMIVVAFVVYFAFDSLPATLVASGLNQIILSFFPLFGVILMESTGFFVVWQLWLWRDRLRMKYGSTSYQRVFLLGFAGITWILTIAFNQYIPYYSFAASFWASSRFQVVATPLDAFLGIVGPAFFYVKYALAVILLMIGLLMCARAVQVFGFDYMVVLYLYFPEKSQLQQNEIYSALRHPAYAGVLLISFGGAFLTFTILSFAACLLFLIGFYLHVHFVEERELIQRFGDSYRSYRIKTPAFFVSPRNIIALLRFLFKHAANNDKFSVSA